MTGILVLIILIAITSGAYLYYTNYIIPKIIHIHAGFIVYVNGKKQDFSDVKYMSFEPCTKNEVKEDPYDQKEKAHLHDYIGDVVHVHRSSAVWGDLFKNIKYKIDSSKPLEAYVNGKKVEDILNHPIKHYDSLVLLLGKHGEVSSYLKNAVKKDHILKVEKMSETCSSASSS